MYSRLSFVVFILVLGGASIGLFQTPPLGQVEGFAAQLLSPAEQTVSRLTEMVGDLAATLQYVGGLRAENERLRAQVDELMVQNMRLQELERQNAVLMAELAYKQSQPGHQFLPAHIISRDPINLVHSAMIDKGRRDGVAVGTTVITPRGLVGQVVRVYPLSAKVLLISDSRSSVDAILQGTGTRGIVSGQRRYDLMVMRYIRPEAYLNSGDLVVTSGLGGVFPPGLAVGRVSYVQRRDTEMFQEAYLEPAVNLGHLARVLVITSYLPVPLEGED